MKITSRSAFLILVTCAFLAAAHSVHAQKLKKQEVPSAVIAAFEKSYPKAIVKSYTREDRNGQTVYKLESRDDKVRRDIIYSPEGAVLEIEERRASPSLPDPVKKGLNKEYPQSKVRSAEKLTRGTAVEYEMVIKSGKQTLQVIFDNNGNLLKANMVQ